MLISKLWFIILVAMHLIKWPVHLIFMNGSRKVYTQLLSFHQLQLNFNGSNTFGTMKMCSRQGWFEPLRVYYRTKSGGITGICFPIFFNMKVYYVFSLESPQRGDSNESTQNTISQYIKENHPKLFQICNYGI